MKLKRNLAAVICLLLACMYLGGCSRDESTDVERNYLGGTGEIQNGACTQGLGDLYDEENIYFCTLFLEPWVDGYWRLDDQGLLSVKCDIASCTHSDIDCEAVYAESHSGTLFMFGDTLYLAYDVKQGGDGMAGKGYIKNCESGEVVFDNPVPEGMDPDKKLDDSSEIFYYNVLSGDRIKIEGNYHAYILDADWNVLYWYDDVGKLPWGCVRGNHYYYVNDVYQLVCVDLDTKETSILSGDRKAVCPDDENGFIYYTDEFSNLHRMEMDTEKDEVIATDIGYFSAHGDYLYCGAKEEGREAGKHILDTEGNLVFDYTDYENMDTRGITAIEGKCYTTFNDEGHGQGVAQMDANGQNYTEYYLE